jgi:UDP-N-acetylmuramoyl-L-alanyl-D-glutamate--2,6-diaminopimelate ligase
VKLKDIIQEIEIEAITGSTGGEIRDVVFDSRQAGPGSLFVAIRGYETDGHLFIGQALSKGASAVICENEPVERADGITWIRAGDSRRALALAAAAFYRHPSRELLLVGVTGTNGKTTIASLLHRLHTLMGFRSGLLSTIQVLIGEEVHPATHTTPDPVRLNALMRQMVDSGCEYCFMEVSSHAVSQQRTVGLKFTGGIFTNITRDHLDYHADFREYLNAKKGFFDSLPSDSFALVNADDRNGTVMLQNCKASGHTYSIRSAGDFAGKIIEMHLEGTSMLIDDREVWVTMPGRFNASNLMAVYGASVLLGNHRDEVIRILSELKPVRGRFETYLSPGGVTAIIDYAHTPDALQNVLETIREVNAGGGMIITVVGAGGNRDRGKRPQMARIAAEGSQRLILTSDNPRFEDPEKILDDMVEGLPQDLAGHTLRIAGREEAIRTACLMAGRKDIILVAGKGHEQTQEIQGEKFRFDDMEIVRKNLK